MQISTRKLLLQYLHNNPGATIKELSRRLNITEEGVHYHIKILLDSGEVRSESNMQCFKSKGRPSIQYRLTGEIQLDNFKALCSILLDHLVCKNLNNDTLTEIAVRIIPPSYSSSLRHRLNHLIIKLNEQGYLPFWEAHFDGPHLFFRNCPYIAILQTHPELCVLDCRLIQVITSQTTSLLRSRLITGNQICELHINSE
jgi:predicted ArsR family transcriptional regulator